MKLSAILIALTPILFCLSSLSTVYCQTNEKAAGQSQTSSGEFDAELLEAQVKSVLHMVKPATVALFQEGDEQMGGATAVIVSKDGLVVTAGHCVMEPDSKLTIVLPDGRELGARGLGLEPTLDCGLVQINKNELDGAELPTVELGWSAELKVNQPCISLGHSGGYDKDRGVVVRVGRIAEVASDRFGFIQSTCLMEPGDSGGPLFDMNGRLIGVHSQIDEKLQKNYEVPVDVFRRYWNQLISGEKFHARRIKDEPNWGWRLSRGSMMMIGQHDHGPDHGPEKGQHEHGPEKATRESRGARISKITPDGWAETNGFQKNDRIVSIGDSRVSNSNQLENLCYRSYLLKESQVEIKFTRSGDQKSQTIDFSNIPRDQTNPKADYSRIEQSQIAAIPQLENLPKRFAELESKLDDYCVSIESKLSGKTRKALGTIFSIDSTTLIVSKSSLVGKSPTVLAENKEPETATIIARDDENDIVLMRIELPMAGIRNPAEFTRPDNGIAGEFLLTPHPKNAGEVSVLGCKEFSMVGIGFFGVMPGEGDDGQVVLTEVVKDSAAEKAGLEIGDVILVVANEPLHEPFDLITQLSKFKPGDMIQVQVLRGEVKMSKDIKLGSRPRDVDMNEMGSMHIADEFAGGKSNIRSGFKRVYVHDGHILPRECGGPVFTTTGGFVGVNIARFSRTQTYVIPADRIMGFIDAALEHQSDE